MKLLIATGLFPPESGGPATYAAMLQDQLPEQGVEVTVLPFHTVKKYPKVLRHLVYTWHVWLQAKDVDMVYALDGVSVGLPALLAARLRCTKFILRLGGDYAWEQGGVRFGVTATLDDYTADSKSAPRIVRLLAYIQTYVAKRALVVVAPSDYLKRIIEQWGVAAEKVVTIYSNLIPVLPKTDVVTTKDSYQLKSPVITTAGRLVPWKGIRTLIDVVSHLAKKYPEIQLLIIGDGPQEAELQAHIAKYNLYDRVRLVGRLSRSESASLVTASDLFVLNTAYEGLSHQLLEVMDWGTPIVTTTVGGNPELLTSNVDSLLVSFNDAYELEQACVEIIDSPDLAERLTTNAKEKVQNFSQEKAVASITKLLKQIHETT